jgi:methionyl-tRNA formyltransferase
VAPTSDRERWPPARRGPRFGAGPAPTGRIGSALLRTVFLGTSEFAAAVLARMGEGPHRPLLVVTRPDRPSGRGRRVSPPAVARKARELSLPLWQPESVNREETLERLARERPQVLVVCAFGALIKEPLLSAYEILNIHPSLLPRWRGAAPVERALMAGDAETGVSIMRLEAGLDSGPICLARAEPIRSDDDYGSLAVRLQELGAELILEVLDRCERGERLHWSEQDDAQATYAEKIEPADRLLDPARSARELERVVRGLHPHVGARVALADGTLLGVMRAALAEPAPHEHERAEPQQAAASDAPSRRGEPLLGVHVHDDRLLLCCADGALTLLEVKPPGGRPMDAGSYVRGHRLPVA